MLLTGDIPFRNEVTRTMCTELARTTGLEQLEKDLEMNGVGDRAGDFVLRLLVFDEARRMDAKQALDHDWFSNRAHKAEFEKLYKRSTKRWKPRVQNRPLTIQLSDLMSDPNRCSEAQDSQSQQLDDIMGAQSTNRSHSLVSATLSDPALPPHHRSEDAMSSQSSIWGPLPSRSQTSFVIAQPESSGRPASSNDNTQISHEDIGESSRRQA